MKRPFLLLSSLIISITIGLVLLSTLKSVSADSQSVTSASSLKNAELSASLPLTNSEPFELLGQLGGQINHVAVSGTYAYVNMDRRLAVLDITEPTSVALIEQFITMEAEISDIDVYHQHLFVGTKDGLHIFDLTEPRHPHLLSVFPNRSASQQNRIELQAEFLDNYAYVLADQLSIIDISTPAKPTRVAFRSIAGFSYAFSKNYLITSSGPPLQTFQVAATKLQGDGPATEIYSLSDRRNPTQLSIFGCYSNAMVADDTHLYRGTTDLEIMDISDPLHVVSKSTTQLGLPGLSDWLSTTYISKQGNQLYLSGQQYHDASHTRISRVLLQACLAQA